MADLLDGLGKLGLQLMVTVAAHLQALGSLVGLKTFFELVQVFELAPQVEVGDGQQANAVFQLQF